jgi:transcriptional regulator with PAS, ATPase and Fis domain
MKEVLEIVNRVADADATVLITGETGVGKEIVAREIHKNSLRKDGPFIKVNCASIPESLFESELFGYEKGAFTGATNNGKLGMFELANKGTILLDEIGEIPLNIQSKLLRVLQEKKVTRLGGTSVQKVDVRILAATNLDLKKQVEKGLFREDLYYRLNVIPINIPPLRERREDLFILAAHFLAFYNSKYNKDKTLAHNATELLRYYPWPGNVRELKNLIERLVLICPQEIITDKCISKIIGEKEVEPIYDNSYEKMHLNDAVATVEKELIYKALKDHGTTRGAAKVLGVSQPTIVRKANKYGIQLSD